MVRTYYKKGDIKEGNLAVIDGKTYYFDHVSKVRWFVGWRYIPLNKRYYNWSLPKWYQIRRFSKVKWGTIFK